MRNRKKLPFNLGKQFHPLSLCFHFFNVFQKKTRSLDIQHSLSTAESNSWKLEDFFPFSTSSFFNIKCSRFFQRAISEVFLCAKMKVQSAVLFAFKKINCVIRFAKFCTQHIWEGRRFFSPNTFARTVIKICVNDALKSILKLQKGEAFINQPATDIKNFARKSAVRTSTEPSYPL